MSDLIYYILSGICVALVLLGINLMSKVRLSVTGNALSALSMVMAIVIIIFKNELWPKGAILPLYGVLAIAAIYGIYMASRIKMIAMPQTIALLNGLGGAASALVAATTAILGATGKYVVFETATAGVALAVGGVTLTGSLIAARKLARMLDARPKSLKGHNFIFGLLLVICVAAMVLQTVSGGIWALVTAISALVAGLVFVMRVGGADMPITIGDPLLVVVGGIVGASGLILTQDMCKAMNRTLGAILTGKTTAAPAKAPVKTEEAPAQEEAPKSAKLDEIGVAENLQNASAKAYDLADRIHFDNAYCRRDIGQRALAAGKEN